MYVPPDILPERRSTSCVICQNNIERPQQYQHKNAGTKSFLLGEKCCRCCWIQMRFERVFTASNWFRLKLNLPHLRWGRPVLRSAEPEPPSCSLDHPTDLKQAQGGRAPAELTPPVGFSRVHQRRSITLQCRASPPRNALRPFWLRDRSSQICEA